MEVDPKSNRVALVCSKVREYFDRATETLDALLHDLESAGSLKNSDWYLIQSSVLLVLLDFEETVTPINILRAIATEETFRHWSVLDLSVLSTAQLERFYANRLADVEWQERGITDPQTGAAALRQHLFPFEEPPEESTPEWTRTDLKVEVLAEDAVSCGTIVALSFDRIRVLLEEAAKTGETLRISIPTAQPDFTLSLETRVVEEPPTEKTANDDRGVHVLEIAFAAGQRELFESFLIAQTRCVPWPGRSGRRFERFPICLPVTFELDGTRYKGKTANLSRGGGFICTQDPAPLEAELELRLEGCDDTEDVKVQARVAYVTPAGASGPVGMGVQFLSSEEVVEAALRQTMTQSTTTAARRVMIVDDDRFFREVVGGAFRVAGYEVLTAKDGVEALQTIVDELLQLDVVVLDLFMPGMTGVEVIDKIRRVGGERDLLIVVLSGSTLSNDDIEEIRAFGADGVFSKSLDPTELTAKVDALVADQWASAVDDALPDLE